MIDITRSPWAYQEKKKKPTLPKHPTVRGYVASVAKEMGVQVMWVIIRLKQWKAPAWFFSSFSSPAEVSVDTGFEIAESGLMNHYIVESHSELQQTAYEGNELLLC